MIDIHSHILPGLDDGAQTIEESLAMGRAAVEDGIHKIVATPHHKNGVYKNFKNDIVIQVAELNRQFQVHGIDVEVLPGQENRIHGELIEGLKNDEILPVNSKSSYVFIEFPSGHVPRYSSQILFDTQVAGFTPIIVHPERNKQIMEHPNILHEFISKGCHAQLTAGSICGKFGKKIKKFSEQLIEADLIHLVASDAHNTSSRGFSMTEAFQEIEKTFGGSKAYQLAENAEYVVMNEALYSSPPTKIAKRKFFNLF
ncbi:tyrosine-protein phosphatase [Halobacillus sp. KGW1]|uniref:tyrosine-protein phosphatase n=1 Tax=Halobacillus sp. KGW1 TaxID=1793726 RepID=UPI000784E77A|nr:CpsB/CapC family capsule biosynthesis tyrosine phosphatase [Halobacillus sp. KGW1]